MQAALLLRDGTSLPGLRQLILALDGKVARCSGDRAAGTRALHMVSAFLVREGLTLAQKPCAAKGNEITAIPRLLERMILEGAVVTIDAAGCQRAIVQALRAAGTDYVLAVKRNQPSLHAAVRAAFEDAERRVFRPAVQDHCETRERNGGRTERRTCTVLGGPGLGAWVADPAGGSAPCATTSPVCPRTPRLCWPWSAATGVSRMACTAPWTCSSGRTTAACARATGPL